MSLDYYNKAFSDDISDLKKLLEELGDSSVINSINEYPEALLLIKAFSFIRANMQIKSENNFENFLKDILEVYYPRFNYPIPYIGIIAVQPKKGITSSFIIEKNYQILLGKQKYKFITTFPCKVIPLKIIDTSCSKLESYKERSTITIKLQPCFKIIEIPQKTTLRFFINDVIEKAAMIHNIIFNKTESIEIKILDTIQNLSKDDIKLVGFCNEENIIPNDQKDRVYFECIKNFSILPQKYFMFDIILDGVEGQINDNIIITINLEDISLVGKLSTENLLINVATVINLFECRSDVVRVSNPVLPYVIISSKYLIYSVERVFFGTTNGEEVEAECISSTTWTNETQYQYKKEWISEYTIKIMILSSKNDVVYVLCNLLCTDHLIKLPTGVLEVSYDSDAPIHNKANLCFLRNKTPALKDLNHSHLLSSHLSLNFFNNKLDHIQFKQVLKIYQFPNEYNKLIDSISDFIVQTDTELLKAEQYQCFIKGNIIEIYLNTDKNTYNLVFLFGKVLENFFSIYCSINSYTKIRIIDSNNSKIIYHGKTKLGTKYQL